MASLRYPILAENGDTVDLEDIYSGTSFGFDADFTPPSWLTLNSNNELVITQNAVAVVTPFIKRR